MCKILLRGAKVTPMPADPVEAVKKFKPGDFVAALPDDHVFGKEEVEPLFTILSVPNMTVQEAELLCISAKNILAPDGSIAAYAPRAAVNFDLDLVDADVTKAELLDTITLNPLLDNPAIIGSPSNELG